MEIENNFYENAKRDIADAYADLGNVVATKSANLYPRIESDIYQVYPSM